jgi:uncharacterized protein YjbI with pentapeptide repeats
MTTRLDQLANSTGKVREILRVKGPTEIVDLSREPWHRDDTILKNLVFENVLIRGVEISAEFVSSTFEGCQFERVRSRAHFWGADCKWIRCSFADVTLRELIAPGGSFEGCQFRRSQLVGFRPDNCRFTNSSFEDTEIRGMHPLGATTFTKCSFARSRFVNCWFADTRFASCSFDDVSAQNCSFAGASATPAPWWSPEDDTKDPFLKFVDAVSALAAKRLGSNHVLSNRLDAYRKDYVAGHASRDGLADTLYASDIPARESARLDEDLDVLYADFGHL